MWNFWIIYYVILDQEWNLSPENKCVIISKSAFESFLYQRINLGVDFELLGEKTKIILRNFYIKKKLFCIFEIASNTDEEPTRHWRITISRYGYKWFT